MPDFLSLYAQAMPDKLAVVDDRPDGTILTMDVRRARGEGQPARPTCCSQHGAGPGRKVVWCGQNSPGVVTS